MEKPELPEQDGAAKPSNAPASDANAAPSVSPAPKAPPAERALYDEVADLRMRMEAIENPLSTIAPEPKGEPANTSAQGADVLLPLDW